LGRERNFFGKNTMESNLENVGLPCKQNIGWGVMPQLLVDN
jgi:hypothetical protein